MTKITLAKTLSDGRLADLFHRTKLSPLSASEESFDQSYLEAMIASAAKIDTIEVGHLPPATHAFDVAQRLRKDQVTETNVDDSSYQKLAPVMIDGLYSVPSVIE